MTSFFRPFLCRHILTNSLLPSPPSAAHFSTSLPRLIKKKMPPKKAVVEKKALLGRPGNNLKIGIVGPFFKILVYLISSCLKRRPERWEIVVFQCSVRDRCVNYPPSSSWTTGSISRRSRQSSQFSLRHDKVSALMSFDLFLALNIHKTVLR